MSYYLKLLCTSFVLFLIFDSVWLGLIAKNIYQSEIGDLMRKSGGSVSPNLVAGLVVYCLLTIGVVFLILPNTLISLPNAFYLGALLGLVVYGVYDFTNLSILKAWPLKISIIDWCWGTVMCSLVTGITYWIKQNYIAG